VNPWLETLGVTLLAVLGAVLGRWFSRLPKPWWTLGYFIPLSVLCLVVLPRIDRSLEFKPPMSWLVSGRTFFAISGFIITMILLTPLSRLPQARARRLLTIFIAVMVFYSSIWPFLAAALNRGFQASLKTRINSDGICEQSTDYNCGPAAAVTGLRKLGLPAEEGEIAILAHTSTAIGTPPDLLCAALRKRYAASGLKCEYRYFKSTSELKNAGITLAVIKFGLFVDHYVTVLEVTDTEIIVGDPFRGKISYTHQEFQNKWRFVGVVLNRTAPLNSASPPRLRVGAGESVPPENQAMVNAFGLVVFQRRKFGHGGGLGFVENRFGRGFQGAPTGPIEVGRVRDSAEQAAPFDDDAINVAGAEQIGDPAMFVQRILVHRGDDLFSPRAVFRRNAIFQIAGNRLKPEFFVADDS